MKREAFQISLECQITEVNYWIGAPFFFIKIMPTRCVAVGCKNTNDAKRKTAAQIEFEKKKKITFHVFPCDPGRKAKWIKIMKLENKTLNRNSRICSVHFKEKFIDRTSLVYVRLRENAIPHMFDNTSCDEMEDEIINIKNESEELCLQSIENTEHIVAEDVSFERYSTCDRGTNTSPLLLQTTRKSTSDKATRMSPERVWNSSINKEIRKAAHAEVERLRKKVKVLQQKVRRKEKKITTVDNILDYLKQKYLIDND